MNKTDRKIKALKKKCDRLLQQKYVLLNPFCLVCSAPTSEMHHYIPKSRSNNLRYDDMNLIPLCRECHCKIHQENDPRINQEIIRKKGHEWADIIEENRRVICKLNLGTLQFIEETLI